jgi:hypothetical protein
MQPVCDALERAYDSGMARSAEDRAFERACFLETVNW